MNEEINFLSKSKENADEKEDEKEDEEENDRIIVIFENHIEKFHINFIINKNNLNMRWVRLLQFGHKSEYRETLLVLKQSYPSQTNFDIFTSVNTHSVSLNCSHFLNASISWNLEMHSCTL